MKPLALVGAKIYPAPDAQPIMNGIVLIKEGKIIAVGEKDKIAVPKDAEVLDCTKRTIVAGFWNSHVHFDEQKWRNAATLPAVRLTEKLYAMLMRYGFTSVVDLGSLTVNTNALRQRIDSGEIVGPRILIAGALFPPNGIPFYVRETLSPELLSELAQPATPAEAIHFVDKEIAEGADFIKLFAVSWISGFPNGKTKSMPLDIIQAVTTKMHRRGKLVFAHPSLIEGVELSLQGHVDILAHTIEDPEHWTDSLIERLKKANIALIPTLMVISQNGKHESILHEVKSFADVGGQILFGTDVGFLTNYDPTKEYELLSQAGLTFSQILASLTTAPAARFGFASTSGRIAQGMDADLVVLDGDPAQDIRAFSKVKYTLRKVQVIARSVN